MQKSNSAAKINYLNLIHGKIVRNSIIFFFFFHIMSKNAIFNFLIELIQCYSKIRFLKQIIGHFEDLYMTFKNL